MTLQLNDDLICFFSDIKIEFVWNDKFHIDFMDYFPLLKKGITTKNTYCKVMGAFGYKFKYINDVDIINSTNGINEVSIIKVYNQYVLNSDNFKVLRDNFRIHLLSKVYSINNNKIISTNFNNDLYNESKLADSLLYIVQSSFKIINEPNELFKLCLCYTFNKSSTNRKTLNETLKTTSIRLLRAVLNNDIEDIITSFYVDKVDFYIGYLYLYFLALSRNNIQIANILKQMIITKNLLMNQVLIANFEDLIGPSDIPNIVYNIIK